MLDWLLNFKIEIEFGKRKRFRKEKNRSGQQPNWPAQQSPVQPTSSSPRAKRFSLKTAPAEQLTGGPSFPLTSSLPGRPNRQLTCLQPRDQFLLPLSPFSAMNSRASIRVNAAVNRSCNHAVLIASPFSTFPLRLHALNATRLLLLHTRTYSARRYSGNNSGHPPPRLAPATMLDCPPITHCISE